MINNISPGFIPSNPVVNPATANAGSNVANTETTASASKKAELEFSPGRNSAKDYSAVQQSLAKGKGAVESAQAATTEIKDSLVKVREVATQLADDSLAAPDREKLQKQYAELRTGIEKSLESASYKGADGGKGVNLLTDKDSSKVTINSYGSQSELRSSTLDKSLGLPEKIGSAAEARDLLNGKDGKASVLATAETAAADSAERLAKEDKKLKAQLETATAVSKAANSLESERTGGRNSARAAPDEESRAALLKQAEETRQQLKQQAMGIGNKDQGARSLLSLFN
ncbi:flagellin/flagellar hook associated protein [Rheinheimera sp. A13L]|uniref:flagellin/flagellar hook associated protein n=1 Tax=Rheinheimera sp. A13L TaxID=506534 RepID=UPI0002125006|nr:flagellin/flagellar hook associated protein [Rheinheimera sp. A13L]EGM77551.1 flagellin/flagellar hook associated protein [Rheinheimera sp. A13L]